MELPDVSDVLLFAYLQFPMIGQYPRVISHAELHVRAAIIPNYFYEPSIPHRAKALDHPLKLGRPANDIPIFNPQERLG